MRLWEMDEDGEPWLENGVPLVIVNSRKKKGKRSMASRFARRKSRSRRRGRKHTVRTNRKRRVTRRRRRSNPWPMAGTVAMANRRRRRRGRKASSRRRRRSHGRRNPGFLGISLPPLQSVIFAGVGFVGTPMAEGFLSRMLPVSITGTTLGKYATRIGAALGLTFLTKMVLGSNEAKMVAIGGGAYVLTSAVTEFVPGLLPASTMSAYRQPNLSGMRGMRAYTPGTGRTFNVINPNRSLGAPNFGAQNTPDSAPFGGMRIVSQRLRRLQ